MATRTASTAGELATALSASSANDVIELQTGSFGALTITNSYTSPGITIRKGSGQSPTITSMTFDGADYITVEDLEIICGAQGDGSISGAVECNATCSHIVFDGCTAKGPSQANYIGGYVVEFQSGSDNCQFKNGIIGQLRIGVVMIGATNCYIGYNTFLDVGEDAIKGFGDGFTVEYNMFPSRYIGETSDHPDGIQCNNSVDGGYIGYNIFPTVEGTIQIIFFGGGPTGQTHANITIEQNIGLGQLNNGIHQKTAGVSHTTSNVIIRNNTIGFLADPPDKKATYVSWNGATTSYNVEGRNVSPGPGIWNGAGNVLALETDTPNATYGINNYYADLDGDYGTVTEITPSMYAPVSGSLVDPDTQGSSTWGAHETIAAWIGAGTWPPNAPVDPTPPASNKRPMIQGRNMLISGSGLPLVG